jgi:hypothetical protein
MIRSRWPSSLHYRKAYGFREQSLFFCSQASDNMSSATVRGSVSLPGIGLLAATAMVAATGGSVSHFKDDA